MNNCNAHSFVQMTLPLNYVDLVVGDIIHIPLINNEKIFSIDYSKVDYVNGQPIYPIWLIMETNISTNSIKLKAYQLHYLRTDGDHGFAFPNETYDILGNTQQLSNFYFSNGEQIPNWNYNPNATIDSGYQIPYFDLNGDGVVNITDILILINHMTGNKQLTLSQRERLKYNSNGDLTSDNIINVSDIISMINIINA